MAQTLPPIHEQGRLALELQLVRDPQRDDALQEAWVAHLEGRDPAQAVNTFRKRERRHRRREHQSLRTRLV